MHKMFTGIFLRRSAGRLIAGLFAPRSRVRSLRVRSDRRWTRRLLPSRRPTFGPSRFEPLEARMVLAANLYVDHVDDFTITNDQGSLGLDAGDTVTWGTGDTAVAGLTFGATAFGTLPAAVTAASAGDTIFVAAGTYAPITIGVAGVTVKTTAGALIQGADAEGVTVRFAANNVRLEGFTIDNQSAADGRAVAPQGFSGGQIVGNTIKNAVRGIQGDFYGRPSNVTITGNTFESTVAYGIAGTEGMSITALSGNTFNTSEEAIGLGAGVSGVTPAGLMANNTFSLSAAGDDDTYGVKDYRDNTIYVKAGDSLQAAINGASPGDTVLVAAGTWTGSLNVSKRLHVIGAGSGADPATNTIIVSTDSSTAAITVSGSGTDADERLSIEGLRVTGGNDGIRIDGAAPVAHLTFTDVVATTNTDSGIHFRGTGSVRDVVIDDAVLSANDNNGIRIASAVSSMIGLSVTDTAINDNGSSGFSFNPSGNLANVGDDFAFTDVTFSRNNADNNNNAHDVSFFGFHGDATLTRVTVDASNTRAYAAVFSNASAYTAAGSIVLEDVAITGTVSKAGLSFQYYNDVSAISLINVDVSGVTAPLGQIALLTQNAAPFDLGNTTLVSLALWSTGDVDATAATFKNAAGGGVLDRNLLADNFTIADQVFDAVDVSSLGTVRWHESYGYVTPTSFAAPVTTTPSIQRAIDAATPGDTIFVAAGTYAPITIGVAGVTVKTTAGALIQGADTKEATVRFAANNVRLEGFTIDNQNAADGRAVAPQGFSGGQIVGNTIKNAVRGIQGDFYGRPTNLTVTGNTFESSVAYGIAGTEDMSITALSGNTFNTSEEAIGLGAGVSGVTPAGLMANNTFSLSAAGDGDTYGVKDYTSTPNTIYVKAGDSLQAAINGASPGDTVLVAAGTYAPITIGVAGVTVKTTAGALIQGADAEGATVRFAANNVRLEGFTIDNQNAADGRAVAPQGFSGGQIVGNTIKNAVRGIQGDFYGRPTNLTVTGNTFESTVAYGIAGTEDMSITALSGNTFNTSEEAIGLGAGVTIAGNALDAAGVYNLLAVQTFDDYAGDALRDYRTSSTYVPVRLTTDSGASPSDRITSDGSLTVTPAIGETIEYSVDNGLTWSDSFTAVEGPNAVMARRVGSTRTDSEPQAFAFTLDTVKPTVTISASRDGLLVAATKAGETATITFTLSESSTNFTAGDVSVTNGTLSEFTGSGTVYTAIFTPAVDTEADAAISVAATTFTDTAGNDNLASSAVTLQVDTVVPTVEITSSRDVLKANQTAVITLTLNTPSTTFTAADVVATGGTLSNFAGSGSVYTATFTPTANFSGVGTVRVLAGSFFDLAGNRSTVAFDLSPTIDVQTNGPYVVSITAATNPIRIGAGTSWITVTLNKHVPSFTLAHLQVTPGAGTFGTLSRVSSASYLTLFTPTAGYVGTVDITVADDAFADTAGNWNVGGALAAPLVVDLVAPDITSITPSLASLKAGQTTPVTFSFNEPVVGFTLSDITVSGGTLSGFTGSGTSYSALFTPRTNSRTLGTISVAANRFTDAAGNPNVQRDLSPPININTVVPSMTISQRLPVLKAGQSTTVTFQVRGQVSNSDPFEAADISLSPEQGSLTNFTGPSFVRGISTYTALYTAPATAFSGSVGLSVPANSFKVVGNDVNGNALTTLAIKIDAIAPTPVISTTASALKISQTATIDFTVDGETGGLIGFEAGDITLTPSSGTLSAPTRVGSTSVYRSTYTPAVGFEGTVTIALAAGKFTDAAGNPNTAAAPITIAVDTLAPAAPTVSLVNDTGVLGNDKITSDAQLQTTGTEAGAAVNYWTTSALTTPWTPALAVQGSNTVYVTQTDTAGNPSTPTAFTFEYRTTSPVVTSITLPAASTGLRAGAYVTLSVRFDRPVFVTGANADRPFITIGGFTTGAGTRRAVYASGSGTSTLVFRYRVVAGDKALAGIAYSASAITLEGATLADAAGNAAAVGFNLPSRRPLTKVNA